MGDLRHHKLPTANREKKNESQNSRYEPGRANAGPPSVPVAGSRASTRFRLSQAASVREHVHGNRFLSRFEFAVAAQTIEVVQGSIPIKHHSLEDSASDTSM